jgi:hypothetical protein
VQTESNWGLLAVKKGVVWTVPYGGCGPYPSGVRTVLNGGLRNISNGGCGLYQILGLGLYVTAGADCIQRGFGLYPRGAGTVPNGEAGTVQNVGELTIGVAGMYPTPGGDLPNQWCGECTHRREVAIPSGAVGTVTNGGRELYSPGERVWYTHGVWGEYPAGGLVSTQFTQRWAGTLPTGGYPQGDVNSTRPGEVTVPSWSVWSVAAVGGGTIPRGDCTRRGEGECTRRCFEACTRQGVRYELTGKLGNVPDEVVDCIARGWGLYTSSSGDGTLQGVENLSAVWF